MSEYKVYKRSRKGTQFSNGIEEKEGRKVQCCLVPGTPAKPPPRRPKTKKVYERRLRKKLATQENDCELLFGSSFARFSSNENNTLFSQQEMDCDKPSASCVTMISSDEKNDLCSSSVALTDKEKELSYDRTGSLSLGSVGIIDLNMILASRSMINLDDREEKDQSCVPPGLIDLNVSKEHSSDGTQGSCLESTGSIVTSKEKKHSFDGIERICSGSAGLIDLNKSIYSLENADGSNEQVMQTHEGESTCLGILDSMEMNKGLNDWDSVFSHIPFVELPSLSEPKASQPSAYADEMSQGAATDKKTENFPLIKETDGEKSNLKLAQDDGLMRENVIFDQIHVNDCINSKKPRQKPRRKKYRPKVVIDGKPTTPKQAREKKPKLATPKQSREKKPKLAAPKHAKEKKSENVKKRRSSGLKEVIAEGISLNPLETKNLSDIQSNLIVETNETKAPVARALDFPLESLDGKPVASASPNVPNKKRRSKRRRKLNWFTFTIMSVTENGKKSKKMPFTVNWCRRKRRLQMKRPQKVTGKNALVSDKSVLETDILIENAALFIDNHGLETLNNTVTENHGLVGFEVCDNTIVANNRDDALVSDKRGLLTMREMEVSALTEKWIEMEVPAASTEMETPALTERSKEMDIVKEFYNSTCKGIGEASTSKFQNKVTGKRKHKEKTSYAIPKPRGRRGYLSKKFIDVLIKGLQSLHICDEGTLVPYQGYSPKVALDSETARVWNLLMNIEDDRSEENETWWEKEREVFAGRQSFFIGNREFIKWNGSVLDSVIGVFLTQNVTDLNSSNAFMSLAAKFPAKPTSLNSICDEDMRITYNQDSVGNQYFVSEPGPEKNKELGKATEFLIGGVEETNFMQKSEHIDPNSLETGCRGCLQLRNTNLPKESHYNSNEILSCKKNLENGCNESREMKHDQISSSVRLADQNGACGSISPSNSIEVEMGKTSDASDCCQEEMLNFRSQNMVVAAPLFPVSKVVQSQNTKVQYDDAIIIRRKIPKAKVHDSSSTDFGKKGKFTSRGKTKNDSHWESLRVKYSTGQRSHDQMDSVDWEAVRLADLKEIAGVIEKRGQQNIIARKIQSFLSRLIRMHKCLDLEWLRNTPPDEAKEYLLAVNGLGLKSVECVRLLSLEQVAFPVDSNVARIAVRLGWVPLQPLPAEVQIHLLELYPILDSIQIYLWPRLCKLDHKILYQLHYQMITFGKVCCTKRNPNCNQCPMKGECKHFLNEHARMKVLPGLSDKMKAGSAVSKSPTATFDPLTSVSSSEAIPPLGSGYQTKICEPIIEEPFEPQEKLEDPKLQETEPEYDSDGIPILKLNVRDMFQNGDISISKALVALTPEAASIPAPKQRVSSRLRTEHLVYELPRNHILLQGLEQTKSDNETQYHLAIWRPGETANSSKRPEERCKFTESELCNEETCFSCNDIREQKANIVRGTLLIPSRVANRGCFPLNATYFQTGEVFADYETSHRPLIVPRDLIYNLRTRKAYFGSSISAILRDEEFKDVQACFWAGIVCFRGFERSTGAPKPLVSRFHCPPTPIKKEKVKKKKVLMLEGQKKVAKEDPNW
ncbi:hypothetical protein REPUB_Repub11eG0140500 [Reevesia pubescens]